MYVCKKKELALMFRKPIPLILDEEIINEIFKNALPI